MANRRMFSKEVTNSDEFMDMPLSSQALYFHLWMNADDDWFVSPKWICRLVQAKEDDLKVLIAKWFCIPFENSVIVITHWKTNNEIKSDRKKDTIYKEHLQMLGLDNGKYKLETKCIQDVSDVDTQDSIGKDRLGEVRLGEEREEYTSSNEEEPMAMEEFWKPDVNKVIEVMKQSCNDAWLQYMSWYKEREFAKHILSKKLANEIEKYNMPLFEFIDNIIKLSAQPYTKQCNTPQLFYQNWWHVINSGTNALKAQKENWKPIYVFTPM